MTATHPRVFHLCLASEWARRGSTHYTPARFEADGFVHCAGDEATTLEVARTWFKVAAEQVLVLELSPALLDAPLRWEAPAPLTPGPHAHHTPGRQFPHVYGPLALAAVTRVGVLEPGATALRWPVSDRRG
jgi:hypothetical protein